MWGEYMKDYRNFNESPVRNKAEVVDWETMNRYFATAPCPIYYIGNYLDDDKQEAYGVFVTSQNPKYFCLKIE